MERSAPARREVVIPGDLLDGHGLKPGSGTFNEGGRIYAARLGIVSERDGLVSVTPLSGRYIPRSQDVVIGKVMDLGPSHWLVDINSPYPAPLNVKETPWRIEFGDTERYMRVGDVLLAEIVSVDEAMRVQLSMVDRQFGRLNGGQIVQISPAKVPRLIGRQGSMIGLIRDFTQVRMFVGQNGMIWLDGDADGVRHTANAIRLVEDRGHLPGLTDAVREYLERAYGRSASTPTEVDDDGRR